MLYSFLKTVLDYLKLIDEEVKVLCRRFTKVLIDRLSKVHIVLFDLYLELVS